MRRGRGALAVAAALVAGTALTGCGDVAPGAAATVDGTRISMQHVDDVARSVCVAEVTYAGQNQQDWQATPTSVYRNDVLALLINEQLALEVADTLGVDVPPSSYQPADNATLTTLLDALSTAQRADFQDYLETYGRLQALYAAIGTATGAPDSSDGGHGGKTAAAAGQKYVARYAANREIELDPRFGSFTAGQVPGGSGSLSVPAGGVAAPSSPTAAPDVSGLPDTQICQ